MIGVNNTFCFQNYLPTLVNQINQGYVSENMKDFGDDTFVIRKVAEAMKRIEGVGFPKEFIPHK